MDIIGLFAAELTPTAASRIGDLTTEEEDRVRPLTDPSGLDLIVRERPTIPIGGGGLAESHIRPP